MTSQVWHQEPQSRNRLLGRPLQHQLGTLLLLIRCCLEARAKVKVRVVLPRVRGEIFIHRKGHEATFKNRIEILPDNIHRISTIRHHIAKTLSQISTIGRRQPAGS